MDEELTKDNLTKANDVIYAIQMQRDQAANAVVMLSAELAAAKRKISKLMDDLSHLEKE